MGRSQALGDVRECLCNQVKIKYWYGKTPGSVRLTNRERGMLREVTRVTRVRRDDRDKMLGETVIIPRSISQLFDLRCVWEQRVCPASSDAYHQRGELARPCPTQTSSVPPPCCCGCVQEEALCENTRAAWQLFFTARTWAKPHRFDSSVTLLLRRVVQSKTQWHSFSNFSNYFKRVLKLPKRSSSFSK